MTTATGEAADDEVLTTEMEEEPRQERIAPATARVAFLSLAGVAGLALLVALLAIVLAPAPTRLLLIGALVVLVLVVVAEVVLLFLARPRKA